MKKASVTTSKLNTYKKNYKRYIQQRQQQQQNQNANTNTNTKYKLVRRSNSQDNLQRQQQRERQQRDDKLDDKLDEMRTRLTNLIEFKTKYYVDQRMITLMQSDDLLTRGSNAISIASDWSTGSSAFMFKYNGETVAKITDGGVLYCKNIWMNGVNMMQLVNKVLGAISDGASIYVKHTDLKSGTYDMDINEAIMKHLVVKYDDKNTLEYLYDNDTAMLMNTDRDVGYAVFNPDLSNGSTIYGLKFGKSDSLGAQLRYTYSTTSNNCYLALGPYGVADTLAVYNNRRVIINTGNSLDQCLICKYNGNLSNSKYLRIGCGDNRDTGIFAYGRESNVNYLYLKLQGRSAVIKVYANYTAFDEQNHVAINNTKTNGGIIYMRMKNVAANSKASLYIGKSETTNGEAGFSYKYSTTNPLGCLGFYGNEEVITYDKYGNMNMNGLTTTSSISCAGLYSSADATIDGKVTCTQIDVANTVKNDWYAKLRVEDYLSNNDYIRMLFKDLSGKANIDLFHDTQYYGLRLKVDTADNTDDNKLCIYPTGVTIDGDLDCYDDVSIWETLEVAKDISVSNTSYGLRANNLSAYSGGTVTVNSNIYIDNNNELQTDILNSAFDNRIQCLCSMEVSNEDNDAIMSADNVTVYNDLQVGGVAVNDIAIAADVNNSTKVNDTTLATTAYVNDLNNTSIHQEIPNNPYESIAITDNPYLKWSINSIGNYNTNTDAVCYSEELHQFVIVGNGYTYFSYDGFTWMSNSMNAYTWTGVTYGPTYGYITCTSSNMFLLSSTDGRTWVPHNNVAPSTGCAIAYGNGYYAIVPDGSNASYLSYTTNPTISTGWGSYWLGSNGKWYNIAYSKSQHKFVVVGASGKYVSFDDEFTSDSRVTGQLSGVTNDCSGVCYSDKLNLWIIAVNDSAYCYISSDGSTFTQTSLPYQTSWHRVVWGGDRFIMTSSGSSSAAYSLDGTSWYPFDISTIGAYSSWLGLAYGNGVFVLSGDNNTAPLNALVATYTSPNSYITPRAMMQAIYPIGSIYMSMVNINPGVIFGGSWIEIQNRFLYAVPTTSTSGQTGGSATHTHQYGIRFAGWWGSVRGLNGGDAMQLWNGSSWINTGGDGNSTTINNSDHSGGSGSAAVQALKTNTGSTSSMPPYVTVYAWYRYA